jgi:hypothetical protein
MIMAYALLVGGGSNEGLLAPSYGFVSRREFGGNVRRIWTCLWLR